MAKTDKTETVTKQEYLSALESTSLEDQVADMIPVDDGEAGEGKFPLGQLPYVEKEQPIKDAVQETAAEAVGYGGLDPNIAHVIGQLQEQVAQLTRTVQQTKTAGDPDLVGSGESGYPWQYYKRPDWGAGAGWVTAAPGGAAAGGRRDVGSFAMYTAKGMKPLMNYGSAPVPSDVWKQVGGLFYPMLERGGAREFPAAQVLAYKWHINPPIPGLRFPAFEAVRGTELMFACEECDLELYFLPDDEETPRACFNHLRGAHQYGRKEAALVLQEQGIKNIARHAIRAANELQEQD